MKFAALLLLASLACVREDRASLHRRPLAPAPASGWARVSLDAATQRQIQTAWIGDAAGRSVPFLIAREGLWESRNLPVEHLLTGKDAAGHPTAEFALKLPEGWQVGEREALHLELDLEGKAPWVAQVKAERQRQYENGGGGFIAYDAASPLHLYDLAPSGGRRHLSLPWDGERYRLTLLPSQGSAPRIRSVSVRAETRPEALEAELSLEAALRPDPKRPRTWRAELSESERIVGLDLELTPPAAPLQPEIRLGEDAEDFQAGYGADLVWNLPALNTRSSRIALHPTEAKLLTIALPEGATPTRLKVLVRRQTLLFPAEAGQAYALHLGGETKPAPGSLGALPSIRSLASTTPLALGPREPDDQGIPHREAADQRARPWMPWVAGLALLVLGAVAWRLFRQESAA